ncbi:Tim44/TimA family putative adaptor protein [Sneathiella chinensis]|uniref:Tim44-like domain-containing protein n=1 Tax=Sneathiella chinensis TaxID=349750 RepID=A0ABQ5U153_9PROT|nr:Tim44/TimA family putative adaptor protein [Sneathiella chinensis]GLQ04930.1 hypothetical protein GCM10007924_01510 [Sneathiella chinensis]
MGEGFQFLDIILLAMIAAFIFLRLRSVLGKRMGHEQSPREELSRDKFDKSAKKGAEDNTDNVIPMNDRVEYAQPTLPVDDSPKGQTLARIQAMDRNFNPEIFVQNAQAAYEAIVGSFASGDRAMLKDLLAEEVYNSFEQSISDREQAGHVMSTDILFINSADIEDAQLEGREAEITIRFEVELISMTRDEDGVVVTGDPHPHKVRELWTFARDLKSRNPNWLLITTRSAS